MSFMCVYLDVFREMLGYPGEAAGKGLKDIRYVIKFKMRIAMCV